MTLNAPFSVFFSQLPAAKNPTKNSAAVTSLRFFLFHDNYTLQMFTGCTLGFYHGPTRLEHLTILHYILLCVESS